MRLSHRSSVFEVGAVGSGRKAFSSLDRKSVGSAGRLEGHRTHDGERLDDSNCDSAH
jgi:hypothetical protein